MNEHSLIKDSGELSLCFFPVRTKRKSAVCNSKEGPHQNPATLAPNHRLLQNCEKYMTVTCKLPSLWCFAAAALRKTGKHRAAEIFGLRG